MHRLRDAVQATATAAQTTARAAAAKASERVAASMTASVAAAQAAARAAVARSAIAPGGDAARNSASLAAARASVSAAAASVGAAAGAAASSLITSAARGASVAAAAARQPAASALSAVAQTASGAAGSASAHVYRRLVRGTALLVLGGAVIAFAYGLGVSTPRALLDHWERQRRPSATRLRVEYRDAPLNVDDASPRFSWAVTHSRRGAVQANATLVVFTGATPHGGPALWSSDVRGSRSLLIPYEGPPLEADSDYSWCVTIDDGIGGVSTPVCATFSTALFGDEDWRGAAWVGGAGDMLSADGALRAEFIVPATAPIVRARLHIIGLGAYHAWLNGYRTDDHELHSFTQFQITLDYDSHDVTGLVREGCNALAVRLTKGWCAQTRSDFAVRNIGACSRTALRALISVTTSTGARYFFATGAAGGLVATSAPSPIVMSDIYAGETFDARLVQPGWDACSFTPAEPWRPSVLLDAPPLVALAPSITPALVAAQHFTRVDAEYVASSVSSPSPGVWVFAFAQTLTGLTRLRLADAVPGTVVIMRHAELLFANGSVHNHYAPDISMTGTYIARGGAVEEYTSEAVSYGFQYVQVEGLGDTVPDERALTALFTHGDVPRTGAFSCSSARVNAAMHATRMSSLSNIADIPTDCPQRERRGWTGDAHVSSEMLIHSWDVGAFYTKWLGDVVDAATYLTATHAPGYIAGQLPCVVPYYPHGGDVCDPNWSVALPRIAAHMLHYNNDTRLAARIFPAARAYAEDVIASANKTGGLLRSSGLGDWCALWYGGPDGSCSFGGPDLASFPYIQTLDATAELAIAAGADADAVRYAALAASARELYRAAYFSAANSSFGAAFAINQLMPLTLGGIVPPEQDAGVYAVLSNFLAHGPYPNTTLGGGGILTSQLLYPVMSAHGDTAAALDLLLSTTWPSFGSWLADGATTLYETWPDTQPGGCDGDGPNKSGCSSRNHVMFAGWATWAFSELAGLRRTPASSAWGDLDLRPTLVPQLTSAAASVDTPMGLVSVAYNTVGNGTVCGEAEENTPLVLACADGIFTSVTFAAFGTPVGSCAAGGFVPAGCAAVDSAAVVAAACVGKAACVVNATRAVFGGDPCPTHRKRLAVVMLGTCGDRLTLDASVPWGAHATVTVPTRGVDPQTVTITEGGSVVWSAGAFVPGAEGVDGAAVGEGGVAFKVGGGAYVFAVAVR